MIFLSLFILRGKESAFVHERGGGGGQREREGERETQAGPVLSPRSPMWSSILQTVRSSSELRSRVERSTAQPMQPLRCPRFYLVNYLCPLYICQLAMTHLLVTSGELTHAYESYVCFPPKMSPNTQMAGDLPYPQSNPWAPS